MRNLAPGARWSLTVGLAGLVAVTVFGVGAAAAVGPQHPARPGSPTTVKAAIRHDEAVVAARFHHCASFSAAHKCPFASAVTTNGSGGHLIAINLRWFTMDACDRGVVYFFDGTKLLVSTRKLRPFSIGGVDKVRAAGAATFAVVYFVNRSASTSCAQSGNGGTDTYKYRWNGTRMFKLSGRPPHLPKVIVGT
jgi:hypothetical protein